MGKALYRKYRSKSLDEIVGQSHITTLLSRAIANGNVAHAYLLTGPKGVGKTSIARILAHEINGLPYQDESTHLDIIEIDAASNNSVEDIRSLREKVMIAPATAAKKIYIIDEVHMLSKSAFNALLKTLEEPPEHAVFILATTDAEKLPATIISRVQRFNFRTITPTDAVKHLRTIANAEAIVINDSALQLIARHGKGSFRDSIGLLDQLRNLSDGEITPELVESVLGLADTETVQRLMSAYEEGDIAAISHTLSDAESRGTPAPMLADQLIEAIRREITEKPHLLPLLDALLDVSRSSWPHVKLLVALSSNSHRPVAVKTEQTTPIATEPKKSDEKNLAPPPAEVVQKKNVKNEEQETADQPFPWIDFIADIKPHTAGAASLLGKCGYEFDGTRLTIYTGKSFTKKQLEKSLPHLSSALEHVGVNDGVIVLSESAPPPKDSRAAAILDIMGGGEEVSL